MQLLSTADLLQGLRHRDIFVRSGILSLLGRSSTHREDVEFSKAVLEVLENHSWDDAFVASLWITDLPVTEEIGRRIFALVADPSKVEADELAEKERVRTLIDWFTESPPEFLVESIDDFAAIPQVDSFMTDFGDRGMLEIAKYKADISGLNGEASLHLMKGLSTKFEVELEGDEDFPDLTLRQLDAAIAHWTKTGIVNQNGIREWFSVEANLQILEEDTYSPCVELYCALLTAKHAKIKLDLNRCLELMDCEWDWIESAVIEAVKGFADEETILELQGLYLSQSEGIRIALIEIFEVCSSKKTIANLVELALEEPNEFQAGMLGGALLSFATPESIDAAYQVYRTAPDENERIGIAKTLYALKSLQGESTKEMDGWRAKYEEELSRREEFRAIIESMDFFNPNRDNFEEYLEDEFENCYDPAAEPDQKAWLETDDDEHLHEIREFVEFFEPFVDSAHGHASIHLIVENQLAENYAPAVEAMAHLEGAGVSRHSAIHAIGSVLVIQMHSITNGGAAMSDDEYSDELKKLNPEEWYRAAEDPMAQEAEELNDDGAALTNYLEYEGKTFQRESPKIGRNDPCLCGSGKKYKKCCLKFAN